MIKKLHLLLALGFWLFTFIGFAQTYPVTISTQLTQPSPIYLSNYADATTINSPIKVQLVLNDLTISNRQIRLKCYFQGNGISLVTNDFVVGARPLYLEGGFPLQLTNLELAPYFEFQNMLGINPNQYAQALPEGIYTFAVEVYDFASGKKLSRKTSVTTIIFQNDPPFLNLPLNNASIMEQNIQNIVFSWTPRQINVSNVEYEFSLVEIWDKYTPVQNAFAYSPALYTTTTRSTTLQYSNTQPQLIPGKRYAWRIKAKAIFGAEEIGVFKNNGYSEIYSFTYEVFCTAPIAIATESVSQDKAKITWSGDVANYDYQVKYREKNANSKWYDLVTPRENVTIANLKPNATYEYTIGASCDVGVYVASSIYEFTTLANDEIAFAGCGIKPDPKDLANKTPLPDLFPNDVVTAGDFPIVVLHSTGSNGTFSGDGYVTLPFLEKFKELIDAADALGGEKIDIGKFSRIRITFSNIGVNTDFKLISGEIIASYDKDWGGMADLDPLVNDVFGDNGKVIPFPVDYVIETIVKNPDGSITITGVGGKPVNKIPKNANDYVFTDKEGNQYAVPANAPAGPIEQTGKQAPGGIPTPANTNGMGSGGNIAQITSPDVTVVFSDSKGIYAFDVAPTTDNGTIHKTYETISKKEGTPYRVNYKAISDIDGKNTDSVAATATFSNGKTKDDIVFKTETGTEIKATWSGNIATLTLKKTLDFAKENVIATVRPVKQNDSLQPAAKYDIAGALSLWHLTSKKVNVTFVSVDGYKTPTKEEAEASLNAIYSKAGISFEVSILNKNLNWPSNLQCGNSGVFETYTDDQNKLIAGFESNIGSEYKNDTYYLFFSDTKPSRSLGGFMPLKRQYGFVFNSTNAAEEGGGNTNKTIAHELGHGVLGLQHPFKQYNTPEGSTNLLMDYGTKDTDIELSHNDWEIMHAPGLQLYQFTQGSSDGASATIENIEGLKDFKNTTDGTYTFMTPSGKPVTLPSNISMVQFATGEEYNLANCDDTKYKIFPFGTLKEFTIKGDSKSDDKKYKFCSNCKSDEFAGYYSEFSNGNCIINSIYVDKITKTTTQKAIVGFPAVEGVNIIFKVGQIPINPISIVKDYTLSGKFIAFDFIAEKISSIKKYNSVYAKFDPDYDLDVKNFIIENINKDGWDGTKFYDNDAYVFIHATQLQKYSLLKDCFKTGIPGELLKFITVTKSYSSTSPTTLVTSTTTYTEPIFKDSYEQDSKKFNAKSLVNHWKKYDINYYFKVKQAIEQFNIPKDATPNQVYELVKPYLNNLNSDNWDCFFNKINIESKINIINKLIDGNSLGDKSEEAIVNLISTIKIENDVKTFYKKLKEDNYSFFRKVWDELDELERVKFNFIIFEWTSKYYSTEKNQDIVAKKFKTYMDYLQKNPINDYSDVNTNVFDLYNYSLSDRASYNLQTSFTTNNEIKITEVLSPLLNILPTNKNFQCEPFDWVVIVVKDNFPEYGLVKGEMTAVPAIFLYNISNEIDSKHLMAAFRVFADGLAIIAAPFTAGASTAFIVVDVGLATTDIVITLNRENIEKAYGKEELVAWDVTYAIWNFYNLGKGIFKTPLFKTSTSLQNISKIEFDITKIDEAANEFIKNSNQAEKLLAIEKLNNLINGLKLSKYKNVLEVNRVIEKAFELRFKLQKIAGATEDIIINADNIVVNKGGLSLSKVEFINNVVTLTKDVRWLPETVKDVKSVATFKDVAYYLNNNLVKNNIEIVENLLRSGDLYIRLLKDTPVVVTSTATLASKLTGDLKSTYDVLLKNGISASEEGSIIKLFDKNKDEIATINGTVFAPKKWLSSYRNVILSKTDSGYWLINSGKEYGFELGYKNTREFTAEYVNEYHVGIGHHSPYKQSTKVFERDLPSGEKIYIVEYKNGGIPNPGGWGSKNKITSVKELREELAVLNDWKNASTDDLVLREYTVKPNTILSVRDGVVGPLQEVSGANTGQVYSGSQHQYEIITNVRGEDWKKYLSVSNPAGVALIDDVVSVFSLPEIKALVGIIPTGSKLTNISFSNFTKAFDADYIKTLDIPGNTKYADDLIKIKNGEDKGGDLTEGIVSEALRKQGYTVTKDIGKYGSNNGFDVVAYKGTLNNPTEIIIIEGKQFKQNKMLDEFDDVKSIIGYDEASGLTINPANPETGLPTQMCMDWTFEHVANKKLITQGGDKTKLANAMLRNKNIVERFVFAIDKSDGSAYFTKLSDNFIK